MKKLFTTLFVFLFAINVFATGVVATAIGFNPTCNGLCNGNATAMASGGVGPYGFTWTGPASYTAAGASISGLCAGTYIVTAIDSSDMSMAMYTLNLTQPSALSAVATGGSVICAGMPTTIASSASGGTPAYTYSWMPTAGLACATCANTSATPAVTTTYTVTVTDANGCTATATWTVTVNPSPTVTASASPMTICAGQFSILSASGASTYSWTPGGFTGTPITVNPTTTTTYTVTGTSAGCTGFATVTVFVAGGPSLSTSSTPATCGSCNGTASVTGPGGTTYSWTGPSGYSSTLQNPGGLCPGTYTVTGTSGSGCSSTATVTVGTSSSVVSTIGSVTPAGCGVCNGSATVFATGGTPPYTYLWSNGTTTATAFGLCAGVYTVVTTDQAGCSYTSNATITNGSSLYAMCSATPATCGLCNGSANVTPTGGTAPYSYDWIPGAPTGDGTPSVSGLCAGTYYVIVTDAGGCAYTAIATVGNNSPVVVTCSTTPSSCGACNGTITVFQSGGVGPYTYDLSTGAPTQTNGNFSGVCSGSVTATVTDANGCTGSYTVFVASSNTSSFTVTNSNHNETGAGLHDGWIDLTISGPNPPYTFAWSNGASTEDVYSLGAGSYSVVITDALGNCGTYNYSITTVPSYGYITGYLYNDTNTNCIFDPADAPLSWYYVTVTNGTSTYYGYTNGSGYYSVWVPSGTYTVTPYNVTNLESGCTSSYSVNVTTGSSMGGNNFAYSIPPIYDVCVYTWSPGIVPGFNSYYSVVIQNVGNMPATGTAYFVLPNFLTYTSATPAPTSISGDTLFWNYTLLPAYSSQSYTVYFNAPASTPLGTVAISYTNATVTNGVDANPGCNYYVYCRVVSGSFDPNEKSVSPSGIGATGDIALTEEEFSYLINFQNTGTGPAVNVSVVDTLSPMLDPMSFEMIGASHPYVVEILPGNVIRWQFDNIMLPDSTSDEPGSHGHVQFKISKLTTPVAGQTIENTANIYFDFNAPVVTNTTINTYVLATNVDAIESDLGSVMVFPNPFNEHTTFVIHSDKQDETYTFEMTDVLGKTVKAMNNISEKQFNINRSGLQNGIYFYKVYSNSGVVGIGKVIIK